MNIFEVGKKENIEKEYNVYRQGICIGKWTIRRVATSNEFEFYNKKDERMSDIYYTSQMLGMEFEEAFSWEDVPVDTKVLVKDEEDCCVYTKRYFAEYKDGYIYTWADGKTSFTTRRKTKWNYGKLYKEQLCDIRIE